MTAGLEDFAPAVVDLAEDTGDHATHLVGRRTGLGRRRPAIGLIARRLPAGENFRAADQDARIDAEGVADETEHDHGADAEPAAAHRKTEATATTTTAAVIATIIVTHGSFPHFYRRLSACSARLRLANRRAARA